MVEPSRIRTCTSRAEGAGGSGVWNQVGSEHAVQEQDCRHSLTASSSLLEQCVLRLLSRPLQRRRRRGACRAAMYASA